MAKAKAKRKTQATAKQKARATPKQKARAPTKARLVGKLPMPLGDTQGIAYMDRLVVFGGGSGEGFRDEIVAVDPSSGRSEVIGRMPYAARGHQVVAVRDAIYLLGGFDGQTRADVHRLDLRSGTAQRLEPMPSSNAWFAATGSDGKIFVVGGFAIPDGYLGRISVYDTASNRWSALPQGLERAPFGKGKVGGNALVEDAGRLISFGGADFFDPATKSANALPHVCSYAIEGATWTPLPSLPVAREGMAVARGGRYAYLVGGMPEEHGGASKLVERFDLSTSKLTTLATMHEGRLTPAAAVLGTRLVIAGGVTKGVGQMTDTIEILELSGG
jgi:hypothetical protein